LHGGLASVRGSVSGIIAASGRKISNSVLQESIRRTGCECLLLVLT